MQTGNPQFVIKPRLLAFLCISISISLSQPSIADSTVVRLFWDKVPLRITLPVGQERLVTFPGEVRVGIPAPLTGKLRTQSHAGTVYWLAKESFEPQRIEVRELDGQGIVLIDLSAQPAPDLPANPIEILFSPGQRSASDAGLGTDADSMTSAGSQKPTPGKKPKTAGLVALTRFAAQQLYAPKRLLKAAPWIQRVSVSQTHLEHLLRGEQILTTPIASWHSGRLYVTAVELKNTGADFIDLDPRQLRGQWRAATFQHARLHPAGSEADTSAVYLVSDRPFHEAL
ncbi:MAG: TIGR03749 family integrating conjugative element protein [Methylomonas sp.]|jgi:integrating conjugative element protein (TIGR03749 family)|uniref:TIGR03749 family integrating conjugative element protein n=1 Tax=Methylomonas sp. TaxID=418 RepID=UPI0025F5770A|nr:TIGR03749 family integrating conjugative element protein [Methylomonas sp.]MCK9608021.1 TIGR03749 family integrating conjugative element protein [Methylomonas sp.]